MCGTYLNRATLINTIVLLPILFMLALSTKPILFLVGFDDETNDCATYYVQCSLPRIYIFCMFDTIKRFLGALKITWVPAIS